MRVLVASVLLVSILAGCASTPSDAGFTTPSKDEKGRYVIELTGDNKVMPAKAVVPAGAVVVWKVGKNGFHDVTSQSGPTSFSSDGEFPQKMREGQEFAQTFVKAGDYAYKCAVHSGMMAGTLRVKA